MENFDALQNINTLLSNGETDNARNELIKLLDQYKKEHIEYTPLLNHLIREVGLFPYIKSEHATWQDQFTYEAFKVNIGGEEKTLHLEQSGLLKKLLDGTNIAVSAPTSFGKSFVIDAFIAIKQPRNVVIILPTIALLDETRRRIHKKFSNQYRIITTSDIELGEKNILILTAERAISYINRLDSIDILIVDEFYKADYEFDKERSPALLKAIISFSEKSQQRYFLAPNINSISPNPFTEDMEFVKVDFNTVYLEIHNLYHETKNKKELKEAKLLEILGPNIEKTLIYAGQPNEIKKVIAFLSANYEVVNSMLLDQFAEWLSSNYHSDWNLPDSIKKGIGVHNGKIHRPLSNIQVSLFEESNGINTILSTSSIIEGVNTSAENVILWSKAYLNFFSYKNVIGRGGRMFKHFVGNIYVLATPPTEEETTLEIPFPDKLIGDASEDKITLSGELKEKSDKYRFEMNQLLGVDAYLELRNAGNLQSTNSDLIKKIATTLKANPNSWNSLKMLNSHDPEMWTDVLYKILKFNTINSVKHATFVRFTQVLSMNWSSNIKELIDLVEGIDIDTFFDLERQVAFKLASIINDINVIYQSLYGNSIDVSSFVAKASHAFLPSVVYQLEEYGLPRMISKKIHASGLINFENESLTIHTCIDDFLSIGQESLISEVEGLEPFDHYIINHFYEGITPSTTTP